jgi:hypothetical protein
MIAIRPGRRAAWRDRADRRSDMLRGAALALVLVGMVASALIAQGWRRTGTGRAASPASPSGRPDGGRCTT